MSLYQIFFSPSGGTAKALAAFCASWEEEWIPVDLSRRDLNGASFPSRFSRRWKTAASPVCGVSPSVPPGRKKSLRTGWLPWLKNWKKPALPAKEMSCFFNDLHDGVYKTFFYKSEVTSRSAP